MCAYRFNPSTGVMEKETEDTSKTVESVSKQAPQAAPQDMHTDTTSILPVIQSFNVEPEEGEREIVFKEKSDLNVVQIVDNDTGRLLGYISGYALDIGFNTKELKSTKKIEQCILGLSSMFRKIIMDQIVGKDE